MPEIMLKLYDGMPYKVQKIINYFYLLLKNPYQLYRYTRIIDKNKKYHNIHNGKRCFILCSGPSINYQPIELLKNEVVFGVSTGYLHEKYKLISPQYHICPEFTYKLEENDSMGFTYEEALEHLRNIEKNTSVDTELFFGISEKRIIDKYSLFKNRKVSYIYFFGHLNNYSRNLYMINKIVPYIRSVPIMGIIIAMYMGFKEIYLLGTDHDSILKGSYKHAFNDKFNDNNLKGIKNIERFVSYHKLFIQYTIMKKIADYNKIKIITINDRGLLDVFPRKNLMDVINSSNL